MNLSLKYSAWKIHYRIYTRYCPKRQNNLNKAIKATKTLPTRDELKYSNASTEVVLILSEKNLIAYRNFIFEEKVNFAHRGYTFENDSEYAFSHQNSSMAL